MGLFKRKKKGYRYKYAEMRDIKALSPELETFKKKDPYKKI